MTEENEKSIDLEIRRKLDKQRMKIKDEDLIETVEEVFDTLTLNSLYKIMRATGIRKLYGVVSTGKESRVYRGVDWKNREYAVKIYLTFTREFKKSIWKYIYGDPRFETESPSTTRKLMSLWAKKEYNNLKRMYSKGIRVPIPYAQRDNIVVMEFIGKNGKRAPLLREIELDKSEAKKIYKKIVENIEKMVCKARLVHADLSEYNIMVYENQPVIIDVSQAVLIEHPNSMEFLEKDIRNIVVFFKKRYGIPPPEDKLEMIKECQRTSI